MLIKDTVFSKTTQFWGIWKQSHLPQLFDHSPQLDWMKSHFKSSWALLLRAHFIFKFHFQISFSNFIFKFHYKHNLNEPFDCVHFWKQWIFISFSFYPFWKISLISSKWFVICRVIPFILDNNGKTCLYLQIELQSSLVNWRSQNINTFVTFVLRQTRGGTTVHYRSLWKYFNNLAILDIPFLQIRIKPNITLLYTTNISSPDQSLPGPSFPGL